MKAAPHTLGTLAHAREDLLGGFVALVAEAVAEQLPAATASQPAAEDWRLLDVDEAAARLGRSTRWVRERAKRGELPYIRLDGGAFAFELDDLRSFAQARRVALADRLQPPGEPASRNGSRGADQVGNRRVRP